VRSRVGPIGRETSAPIGQSRPQPQSFLIGPDSLATTIMVHGAHLEYQQPRVVDALIHSFEAKGILEADSRTAAILPSVRSAHPS
jgi:hypothetical protein